MINRVVVGTLGMMNTVLSPLAPDAVTSPAGSYPLDLSQSPSLKKECLALKNTPAQSHLTLHIERIMSTFFTARLEGLLCVSENQARAIDLSLRLPIALLDTERIESLPIGFGYVVNGLPGDSLTGASTTRVKLTRLNPEEGLVPIRIEWIPNENQAPPMSEPITIWISKVSDSRTDWKRIQLKGLSRHFSSPLEARVKKPL